jgi:hypothetical protein
MSLVHRKLSDESSAHWHASCPGVGDAAAPGRMLLERWRSRSPMRAAWRRRRTFLTLSPLQLALVGGIGMLLGVLAILGGAVFLALNGAL